MNCPNCGYKNRRGVKFCESCGYDFSSAPAPRGRSTVFCAICGSKNAVGSRFCFKCGNALEGIAAPAQAIPQVVVIQQPERRRKWWGLMALLLLLLFGCALISSLVQVTPAMARDLPDFLQDPAIAFGRWQQEADILRTIRQGKTWVTTAWNDIFGGAQTARGDIGAASNDQTECQDYSQVFLSDGSIEQHYWDTYGGGYPSSYVFQGLPRNIPNTTEFSVQYIFSDYTIELSCSLSGATEATCERGFQSFDDLGAKLFDAKGLNFIASNGTTTCGDEYFSRKSLLDAYSDLMASTSCPDLSNLVVLAESLEGIQASQGELPPTVWINVPGTRPNQTPPSWVGFEQAPWKIEYRMEDLNQVMTQSCYQTELISDNGIGLVCDGPHQQSGLTNFGLHDINSMRVWVDDDTDCTPGWVEFPAQQYVSQPEPESDGPPQIRVTQNTMCRKGPGNEYDAIGDLQVGETAEIIAQYSGGDYWVIENYGASGTCWLYGGYAEISGDVGSLPYWEAPALPVAAEPEPEVEPEEEVAGTITFTFNNYLDYASVCSVWVSSVSSSGWGSNLLGGCLSPGESAVLTIPNEGSQYDLKASVCVEGCSDYFEMNITITPGASYPFKPY